MTLFSNTIVVGQNNHATKPLSEINLIDESVYIHCNATTFVTGESLNYRFYCLKATSSGFSKISKIGYIELLNNENESVLKQEFPLENGLGAGDFFISTSFRTGNYKLIAYTNWMLNKAENEICKTDIFIINPYENTVSNQKQKTNTEERKTGLNNILNNAKQQQNNLISIKTNKLTYTTREKVNLEINALTKETKGNFSISVRKIDSLPVSKPLSAVDFISDNQKKKHFNQRENVFLPELRGKIVSGKIIPKDSSKVRKDKIVAFSSPGKYFDFKITKTNEDGKFNFLLDQYPNSPTVMIQLMDEERNDYSIALNENTKPSFKELTIKNPLTINLKDKTDIENRSIANQIENNYYHKKKDSLQITSRKTPFFHPLEKEYVLDDYTRFPSLKETIVEVLFEAYYKKENKLYSLHLRDFSTEGNAYGPTLVMVDGLLIQDTNELFEYDLQNVYKVSLVNQGYIYGPKLFNGVINFVTKKQDYLTKTSGSYFKTLSMEQAVKQKKYFNPDYSTAENDRIPDFRYQLLWQPEVITNEKSTLISFNTSDIKGNFQIILEGFTEKGQAVSIENYITVE